MTSAPVDRSSANMSGIRQGHRWCYVFASVVFALGLGAWALNHHTSKASICLTLVIVPVILCFT